VSVADNRKILFEQMKQTLSETRVKRWKDIQSSKWWPQGIATSDNIDTFHKLRKSVRTLARIVGTYPFIYSPMYIPLGAGISKAIGLLQTKNQLLRSVKLQKKREQQVNSIYFY